MVFKMLGLGLCSGKHSYFASGWNLVDGGAWPSNPNP